MQRTEMIKKGNFVDVLQKIDGLTSSQQRFIQEMLSKRTKAPTLPKKTILKKSFGLWADRENIKSSTDYVTQLRADWDSRLERMKG